MKWNKKGVIYKPTGELSWAKTHAMIPTPVLMDNETIRLYISCRDEMNIARIGYIDLDSMNPKEIKYIKNDPVLDIGKPGCFDDNGVLVTSIIRKDKNTIYLYYVGFEICHNIRYRLLTGLAISIDNGESFTRFSQSPILDRTNDELFFRCGPFVTNSDNVYKMWYVGGSDWIKINNKDMPVYEIKYLESKNGFKWDMNPKTVMKISDPDEHGFGRPFIVNRKESARMFYSIRKKSINEYRLGFADLDIFSEWKRKDDDIGLTISESGFDSKAIMYLSLISVGSRTYGFYNGNNFGETGIGYAELLEW